MAKNKATEIFPQNSFPYGGLDPRNSQFFGFPAASFISSLWDNAFAASLAEEMSEDDFFVVSKRDISFRTSLNPIDMKSVTKILSELKVIDIAEENDEAFYIRLNLNRIAQIRS